MKSVVFALLIPCGSILSALAGTLMAMGRCKQRYHRALFLGWLLSAVGVLNVMLIFIAIWPADELAELKSGSRLIEGSAAKLLADKARLASMISVLQDTLALKENSLKVEEAGKPTMDVLAELCAGSVAELPPTAAFHSSFARPITALPAHRLSLSRVYATR